MPLQSILLLIKSLSALQLSIIIINYNVRYFLEQCLLSVLASLNGIEGEIIVIDNASSDGSKAFFTGRFPEVKFVYNSENKGFGAANNQALECASGEYILFLNPDTILPEDCLSKCIGFLKSKDDNGALGVRMIDGSGKFLKESKRAFPDPLTSLFKLSGLAALFPHSRIFARYYLGHLDEQKNHEVDVLAGAFIMIPRKVLNEVKGFDEDFFMYGEDIDLSYRIQKAGFANYYFADTTIIHYKGESTKKGSLNYVRMFYKAMSIFVKKHYGTSRAGVYNLLIQIGILIRASVSALSRFLKWIGMPVIDLLTILLCFWIVKSLWSVYWLPYLAADNRILFITYPAFALLFLITSYYSGLYDNGYVQSRLNRSVAISFLILFTIYGLIPDSVQFSRGVLLSSVVLAYLMMTLTRIILVSMKIITPKKKPSKSQIILAGTDEEAGKALQILGVSDKQAHIMGRVSVEDNDTEGITTWNNMDVLLETRVFDDLIYCQGKLSFKEIIGSVETLPPLVNAGIFAQNSNSIIGSSDKNIKGSFRSGQEYLRLENPLYCRVKRLFDVVVSLFLILTFPIHLFIKKNPSGLFNNAIKVLTGKKSFVGFATNSENLPPLKQGIITTSGLPAFKNILPAAALTKSDHIYAKYYTVFKDLNLVYRGYKNLS